MIVRPPARSQACASLNTPSLRQFSHKLSDGLSQSGRAPASLPPSSRTPLSISKSGASPPLASPYASISESQKLKKSQERDFLVSVLETSVTKRDAKAYMNKFVPLLERRGATSFKQRANQAPTTHTNGTSVFPASDNVPVGKDSQTEPPDLRTEQRSTIRDSLYVALVKFRVPEIVDDAILDGVAKTLSQLRKLGLLSIVVVECDSQARDEISQRQLEAAQASRLASAIDSHDAAGARVIDSPISIARQSASLTSPFTSRELFVGNPTELMRVLQDEHIAIIPSFGYTSDTQTIRSVGADSAILALTRQLSGLQFVQQASEDSESTITRLLRAAEVYRIIVLDPLGGIPARNRATGRHLFLNLEQEFDEVQADLEVLAKDGALNKSSDHSRHLGNARLAKDALSLLPPTSSIVITTPQEAARETAPEDELMDLALVGTRRGQNPLIHSLLTDKPTQSPSLPTERFTPVTSSTGACQIGSLTTLAKRGMPLTIFPDPKVAPWKPPQPGQSSLRLTDPCIDLPRLVHLIEDSFGRKLDVEHYLKRISGNLAGIIIAGEYEGGALLTWENPSGGTDPKRLVPYLDKFAVLRKSQGAGGVADIVFNAMVRDCFPDGVCWRSRKNNPVNKWYFERSRGTLKLRDMNWTMFWTTPKLAMDDEKFGDYEAVCRSVEPSWADNKQILD
ncbi:N-acetylglutamate synthase [Xylariaceae sp. FL1019]|nr:N-acetylglutamate synthase [Xylariaceae sp. FL1019]